MLLSRQVHFFQKLLKYRYNLLLKIKLPEDIEKIKEIFSFINGEVCLCGSVADYFLLKQNDTILKDIDLVTSNITLFEKNKNRFLYTKSVIYGEMLYTRNINGLCVEIFLNNTFCYEKESFLLKEYNIRCVTPMHRFKYLKLILADLNFFKKDLSSIEKIIEQYMEFYSFLK